MKFFDFGGWYPGNTNHQLLEINRFKEGFGGKIVREYNCEQIVSLKGCWSITIAAGLNRARSLIGRQRSSEQPHERRSPPSGASVPLSNSPAGFETPGLRQPELAN